MFQTDIIRWMQSFDAPPIRILFQGISLIGEEEFFILLIAVVLFGIDNRRGFLLAQVVLWTSIVTAVLKSAFALPRPVDVDLLVARIGPGADLPHFYVDRGAPSFWAALPADVITHYRSITGVSYGLPSGHCSASLAAWGSTALLFRRVWLVWIAGALALLMPLSRMYLGRHFLADVLAGTLVALVVLGVLAGALRNAAFLAPPVASRREDRKVTSIRPFELVFLVVLPLAFILLHAPARELASMLLGVNLGYLVTGRLERLAAPRTPIMRMLSVVFAACAYAGAQATLPFIVALFEINSPILEGTIRNILTAFFVIVVPTLLAGKKAAEFDTNKPS